MPAATVSNLSEELRALHLLEPEQFDELAVLQPAPSNPHALGKLLLERGWLTAYQVNQLLNSRGTQLLLGSYVLLERIGEGGMGQVFKAKNWKLGRIVALKVIRQERIANYEAVRRFQREIRAVAALDHPHVVRAYDADEIDGSLFYAMEYVEGIDLGRLVKESGALPVDQACSYVRQAALGLQHAHEHGMVHRDIKPSNLLVAGLPVAADEGRSDQANAAAASIVKILDMGLARLEELGGDEYSSTVTQAGMVVGTPDFISPEQARDSHKADIRSDLYSLGCTLYYLLTGQVPFPAETATAKLYKHNFEAPLPVEQLRPEMPAGVAGIVRKLMAKRPEDRYQSPQELADVLGAGLQTGTWPTPVAVEGIQAGLPLAAPVTAAAALPVALPVGSTTLPIAELAVAGPEASRQHLMVPAAGPGASRQQLVVLVAGLALFAVAAIIIMTAGGSDDRKPSSAVVAMSKTSSVTPTRADKPPTPPGDPAGWPPAELLSTLGKPGQQPVRWVAFSPDGKTLAADGENRTIRLWDFPAGRERGLAAATGFSSYVFAFSPDGKTLVAAGFYGWIRVWNMPDGEPKLRTLLKGHRESVSSLAFSPDGKWLASGSKDKSVRIWAIDSSDAFRERHVFWHQDEVSSVAFAPDGKTVASGGHDDRVRLWDLAANPPGERASLPQREKVVSLAIDPLGQTLAAATRDRGIRLWDLPTTKQPRERVTLRGHAPGGTGGPIVQFTPDGKTLASGGYDGRVLLWNVAAGNKLREWLLTGPVNSIAFSPDGRYLATANFNGTVHVLRLASP